MSSSLKFGEKFRANLLQKSIFDIIKSAGKQLNSLPQFSVNKKLFEAKRTSNGIGKRIFFR